MCIIVVKTKGQKLPKKETLKNCYINNDDGCGYMFTDGELVQIKKGLYTFDDFYKQLKDDYKKYDLKNKNIVMHFRIGTSGGLTASKCHPFAITNNVKTLNKTELTTDVGVVHNGILSNYCYNKDLSDTQNFIKDFLYYIKQIDGEFYKHKKIDGFINKQLNTSKLAILDKNDYLKTYGDFINDGGCLYSNTSYKAITYKYNYNNYDYLKDYYNYYDDNYDDYFKYYYDYEDALYEQYENGDIDDVEFDFKLNDYDNFCEWLQDFKKTGGDAYSFTR